MKIILSPAKKMIVDNDNIAPVELPAFIDKIAEQNFDRLGYYFRSDLSSDSEYVFERKIK